MFLTEKLKRPSALAVVALLLLASVIPLLSRQKVSAAVLLGPRQVRMSNSNAGQATVTYKVKFQVTSHATNIGGIVVTFCGNSPIIGDTACSFPAGFVLTGATVANQSSGATDSDFTGATANPTVNATSLATVTILAQDTTTTNNNTFVLSNGTAINPASGDYVTFEITGITNPSANGTFYARIYTYATNTAATGYTLANPNAGGAAVDAGGIALSTAEQITITSKVQERLTFCVYTPDYDIAGSPQNTNFSDNDCTAQSGANVILGDANGVLDPAVTYVDTTTRFSITTNASGNAIVRMKGDTLTSGSFTITPNTTPAVSAVGTEQFGVCVYQQAGTGLTIDAVYDGGAGAQCAGVIGNSYVAGGAATLNGADFAFDNSVDTYHTMSLYGMKIATKAPGDYSTGQLNFLGNVSNTTEAGIYTTLLTFIATGTY